MVEFMEKDRWFDSGFENADNYNDIAGLITSLDLQQSNTTLIDIKRGVYEAVNLREDEQVLEVGCGIGGTSREITKFLGKNGRVVGIDKSKLLLQEAIRRSDPSKKKY